MLGIFTWLPAFLYYIMLKKVRQIIVLLFFMFQLFLHILFHILISLIAGFIVYKLYNQLFLSIISALIGGIIVDFDHFIDYFLEFGFNFKLSFFTNGFQFLKNDKMYILLHGWEYAIIFLILSLIFKNRVIKIIFAGLTLGLFFI